MRQTRRSVGIVLWSLLSLDILVGFLDWLGRWDWLVAFIGAHPYLASLVRTRLPYLGLLILGFLFLRSEQHLKQRKLLVRLMNSRTIPDRHTTPMVAVFESEAKTPGWDERKLDWLRSQTIQMLRLRFQEWRLVARIRRKWFRNEPVQIKHYEDFDKFMMDTGLDVNIKSIHHSGDRYREIPSLLAKIRDVPLSRGIGHRGWLRFRLSQVSQKDMGDPSLQIDFC